MLSPARHLRPMRRFFEYFELFREIACQSVLRPLIFAPSQHNAALQSRRSKGCGVDRVGWRSEVCSADRSEKSC
jgi:hypothetical protein